MTSLVSSPSHIIVAPPATKYDVFLSFRGEDTRDTFSSYLYEALCNANIHTFMDHKLHKGDHISPILLKTMEESEISLIIFSKDYASSIWCMDELVHIMKCKDKYGRLVIPIFYDVDPSNIRKQNGSFGDGFAKLKQRFKHKQERVEEWRNALIKSTSLSGWDSKSIRSESKLVEKIVIDVLGKLNGKSSFHVEGLVGIDHQIQNIEELLSEARIVGVWGIGGIGKTTLARAVFDKLKAEFEAFCFVKDVRQQLARNGLDELQQKCLKELLQDEDVNIYDLRSTFVKRRLHRKKILLVLDDVDNLIAVEDLIKACGWFGEGSRIIITSRDMQVIDNTSAYRGYHVSKLDPHHALHLFSLKAFKQNEPLKSYLELSKWAVDYCQGNPLALKVLGCFLHGRGKDVWGSALEKLDQTLRSDIFDALKLSFDALDDIHKNIFLDLAFFLKEGWRISLDCARWLYGSSACNDISVLAKRSLISINRHGDIEMHALLMDMGLEFSQQQLRSNSGNFRPWRHEDISNSFSNNDKNMRQDLLRLMRMSDLYWACYMRETLAKAIFKLQKFEILKHWEGYKGFETPPTVDMLTTFSWEPFLRLPLPSPQFTNHRKLNLERCNRLGRLPQVIWELQKLETLSSDQCSQLVELPGQIGNLAKLKELRLEHYSRFLELPPLIAKLENLKEIRLASCKRLKTLPQGLSELQKLKTLSLEHCSQLLELPPQIAKLKNLEELRLIGCKRLMTLPQEIWELQKLKTLSLEHCSQLLELPPQIAKLTNLEELRLIGCKRLVTLQQEIWELPNLQNLSLVGTSIFITSKKELINSNYMPLSSGYDEHSGRGKKSIPTSSSAIIPPGTTLKLIDHKGFKQFEQICQKIMQLQIQNIEICDLSGTQVTHLPQFVNFPKLRSFLLRDNLNLMKIPSSFFDHVPLLSIIDSSHTSIHELPSSIFNLQELRELYLKDCELFEELPPDISRLSNLTTLDLHGTLITHLPKEIEKLTKLESLSLSFLNDDSSFSVIPLGVLSKLTHLKVLRIGVNSDNEWWFNNIEHILAEINGLEMLQVLDLYIPRVNFLNPRERCLSNFRFIIGQHKPRMISRVPPTIEVMFNESSPSLKFVHGQVFPNEVKSILSEAWAFFVDRHMTINNLTQFGLENLKQLRLCILSECNEMQSIMGVNEYGADYLNESLCMQFLTIFYMKNLRSIINKATLSNSFFCELKLLSLHTCPELTTIFTMHFLHALVNLEELIVEDCPKVRSIISCASSEEQTTDIFLPRLRKLSLLFVPELDSISNGVPIGRNLEQMGLYYCPKLRSLSTAELSSERLQVIRGEMEWWKKLQWSRAEWGQEDAPHKFNQIFSPIDEDLDILTQLTPYELTSFNKENDSGYIDSSGGILKRRK